MKIFINDFHKIHPGKTNNLYMIELVSIFSVNNP